MHITAKEKYMSFTQGKYYPIALLIISALGTLLHTEGIAAFILVTLISLSLFSSKELHATLLPFLLTCLLAGSGVSDYYSFGIYIIAVLPLFVSSIVYNIVKFKKKLAVGAQMLPLLFVMAALFLGGVTERTAAEYFRAGSIFHVLLLGPGMLAVYLILRVLWYDCDIKKLQRSLTSSMLCSSLYCVFFILSVSLLYSQPISEIVGMAQFVNLASFFLAMSIPFAFEKALDNNLYSFFALVIFASIAISGSRTGVIAGGIITALCYIRLIVKSPNKRVFNTLMLFFLVTAAFVLVQLTQIGNTASAQSFMLIAPGESRISLIARSISDFTSSPIFGQGICYAGNSDCFSPMPMAMHWYHNIIAQIIGSMGLVGIAAYIYMFITRIKLLAFDKSDFSRSCLFCYFAVLLGSMTDPGIFSPIPCSVIIMFFFVISEIKKESENNV